MKFNLLKVSDSDVGLRVDQLLTKKLSITRENVKKKVDCSEIYCLNEINVLENNALCEANDANCHLQRNIMEAGDSLNNFQSLSNDNENNISNSGSPDYAEDDNNSVIIENINTIENKKAIKLSYKLSLNDGILFKFIEEEKVKNEVKDLSNFDFQKMIVFEDDHLIVINKEWNILTHDKPGDCQEVTIVDLMRDHLMKQNCDLNVGEEGRECIVHRLDKETSGLMVLAKTQTAYQTLTKMFKDKEISKKYLGIVCGKLNPMCGKIKEYIGRDKNNRMKRCVVIRKTLKHYPDAKEAVTHFFMKEEYMGGKVSLAEFILETGRTHQIRVHMDFLKCPILGDKMYGMNRNNDIQRNYLCFEMKRHMLHSHYLQFEHPITKENVELECGMPSDMKEIIKKLKSL
jgi:23S rRNA pseudouridine1911/1915/1917 synthase